MSAPLLVKRKEAIAKICRAIEDVRASRAATQHAIERSRRSLGETHALLVALRLQVFGANRPAGPAPLGHKVQRINAGLLLH